MQNLGGGSAQQGVAVAVAAMTELPAMVLYGRLSRRMGVGRMLCLTAWVWVAKDLLTALAATPAACGTFPSPGRGCPPPSPDGHLAKPASPGAVWGPMGTHRCFQPTQNLWTSLLGHRGYPAPWAAGPAPTSHNPVPPAVGFPGPGQAGGSL